MGKASTRAKNKYNTKAYDRIAVNVKKGMKDEWKSEAEKQGLSLNAFIEQAVNHMMTFDNCTNFSCATSDSDTEILNAQEKIINAPSENEILDDVILKLVDSCQKILSAHLQLIDLFHYDETDDDSGEIKSPYKEFIKEYLLTIISEDIYRIRCCVNDDIIKDDVESMLRIVSSETEHIKDHTATNDLEEYLTEFNTLMNLSDE